MLMFLLLFFNFCFNEWWPFVFHWRESIAVLWGRRAELAELLGYDLLGPAGDLTRKTTETILYVCIFPYISTSGRSLWLSERKIVHFGKNDAIVLRCCHCPGQEPCGDPYMDAANMVPGSVYTPLSDGIGFPKNHEVSEKLRAEGYRWHLGSTAEAKNLKAWSELWWFCILDLFHLY